jgi:glycosyltransferase involved in cell wall biosynthesis
VSQPAVSVIIPAYNRQGYILETLESVWVQTCPDFEVLVVDDGSTDGTRELLEPYAQAGRLRYFYQANQGASAARNSGIRLARGRYLAFLDSDDLSLPERLKKQAAYLDAHPEIGLVHAHYVKFDESGADLGRRDPSWFSGWIYPQILLEWSVLLSISCVMVRAAVLQTVGLFDASIHWGEDLDLWRRISRRYPLGCIPEVLLHQRVHSGGLSIDKAAAVASFERYLQKAFSEDSSLGPVFRRRALAKMYANMAHNILASGQVNQFGLVRQLSWKALSQWPLQFSALVGLGGSRLSPVVRQRLLAAWQRARYKSA